MEKVENAIKETKETINNIKYHDLSREARILKNQLLIMQMISDIQANVNHLTEISGDGYRNDW